MHNGMGLDWVCKTKTFDHVLTLPVERDVNVLALFALFGTEYLLLAVALFKSLIKNSLSKSCFDWLPFCALEYKLHL